MSDTGTIARLGRAPAVTLAAATQRPTQKVIGQGAVRSQMNIRISFRVEENNATLTSSSDKASSRPDGTPISPAPPESSSSQPPSTTPPAAPAPTSSPTTT